LCIPRSLIFKILFAFLSCPMAVKFIIVILFFWICTSSVCYEESKLYSKTLIIFPQLSCYFAIQFLNTLNLLWAGGNQMSHPYEMGYKTVNAYLSTFNLHYPPPHLSAPLPHFFVELNVFCCVHAPVLGKETNFCNMCIHTL
jgi:hypothetical protein